VAAGPSARRKAAKVTRRKRPAAKLKASAKAAPKRQAARKPAPRKAVTRKVVARKAVGRKVVARKVVARKVVARKAAARKMVARAVTPKAVIARKQVASRTPTPAAPRKVVVATEPKAVVRKVTQTRPAKIVRRAPGLDRARRVVLGEEIVSTPPSSLNLDRTASAVRSGRRELRERLDEHHETSPAMTAGDIDADWEGAYSSGDEAPGGDNPTPDQDVVDDIGIAVGVHYEDNEELKGEAKIIERDKHRWELDPASSDDYDDR
jgi:hypothetical protein